MKNSFVITEKETNIIRVDAENLNMLIFDSLTLARRYYKKLHKDDRITSEIHEVSLDIKRINEA